MQCSPQPCVSAATADRAALSLSLGWSVLDMISGNSPESLLSTLVQTALMELTFDKNDKRDAVTCLLVEISESAGRCHANRNVFAVLKKKKKNRTSALYGPWHKGFGFESAGSLNVLPVPAVGELLHGLCLGMLCLGFGIWRSQRDFHKQTTWYNLWP